MTSSWQKKMWRQNNEWIVVSLQWLLLKNKNSKNGGHFADEFSFFAWKCLYFDYKITEVVPNGPIDDKNYGFRYSFDTLQLTSYCLNPWWPGVMTHMCITRPLWIKRDMLIYKLQSMQKKDGTFRHKSKWVSHLQLPVPWCCWGPYNQL